VRWADTLFPNTKVKQNLKCVTTLVKIFRYSCLLSKRLWQRLIHYTNTTLCTVHCLVYTWHTRRFGSWLYSRQSCQYHDNQQLENGSTANYRNVVYINIPHVMDNIQHCVPIVLYYGILTSAVRHFKGTCSLLYSKIFNSLLKHIKHNSILVQKTTSK
jgi:hypothetical protein